MTKKKKKAQPDPNRTVGSILKSLRHQKQMTQQEAADGMLKSGMTMSLRSLIRYEKDQVKDVGLDMLKAFANYYGQPLKELLP